MASFNEIKNCELLDTTCDISSMRVSYLTLESILEEENITKDPFNLFKEWFDLASKCAQIEEPNAMCLASATRNGIPSARYVLLKYFSNDGFTFFTNYCSRKGEELEENPNAAAVFYWGPLRRSVRVEGTVSKISEKISDDYFHSRPLDSQIAACVSNQSCVIPNREFLHKEETKLKKMYENKNVPRPKTWGGYLIKPHTIEFWQGQSNRLHDRIVYRKLGSSGNINETASHVKNNEWIHERLSP